VECWCISEKKKRAIAGTVWGRSEVRPEELRRLVPLEGATKLGEAFNEQPHWITVRKPDLRLLRGGLWLRGLLATYSHLTDTGGICLGKTPRFRATQRSYLGVLENHGLCKDEKSG